MISPSSHSLALVVDLQLKGENLLEDWVDLPLRQIRLKFIENGSELIEIYFAWLVRIEGLKNAFVVVFSFFVEKATDFETKVSQFMGINYEIVRSTEEVAHPFEPDQGLAFNNSETFGEVFLDEIFYRKFSNCHLFFPPGQVVKKNVTEFF